MPIRYRPEHFEFPKNMSLPVFKELPEGFEIRSFFGEWEAWNRPNFQNPSKEKLRILTKCHHCGGWVEGRAHKHHVNNLDGSRLCGRRGTEYYCPRCANEIHFSGMMS